MPRAVEEEQEAPSFQELLAAPLQKTSTAQDRQKSLRALRALWDNKAAEDALLYQCDGLGDDEGDDMDADQDGYGVPPEQDKDTVSAARRTVKAALRVVRYDPASKVRVEGLKLLTAFMAILGQDKSALSSLVPDMQRDIVSALVLKAQDVGLPVRTAALTSLAHIHLQDTPLMQTVSWNDMLTIMKINLHDARTAEASGTLLMRALRETGEDFGGNRAREAAFAMEKLKLRDHARLFDSFLRDNIFRIFGLVSEGEGSTSEHPRADPDTAEDSEM